jgi:hypothetical protein
MSLVSLVSAIVGGRDQVLLSALLESGVLVKIEAPSQQKMSFLYVLHRQRIACMFPFFLLVAICFLDVSFLVPRQHQTAC